MRSASTDKNNITAYARQFITSALLASGFIHIAAPMVLAAEAAGTKIENTATASYEDPNDPGKPLNAISNTVTVEVAEVAGITITPGAVTGGTGTANALVPGDTAYFGFTVTNVGNDTTGFNLPGTAKTLGPVNFQTIEYLDPVTNAWTPIPGGAASNQVITKAGGVGFAPNESLQVRVKTTVGAGATGDATVFLGNTPGTGLTPGQADQNISFTASGGDVFTVDSEGKAGDVAGAPSNGIREASNFLKTTINVAPKPIQAFATVLENSTYTQGSPTVLTDDKIDYNLTLKVAQTSPDAAKDAGDLAPSAITVDGANVKKVLVSTAVPAGTIVDSASAPVGSGWTVVYTTDPVGTLASAATWKTGPLPATGVTRIGFIADGPILKGTVQTDLKMTVKIDPAGTIATTGSGTVASISQVFGNTVDPLTGLASTDPTKTVYDESGDQNPNNYDGAVAPATNTPTNGVGVVTDPDPGNGNSGTTLAGETNLVAITNTPTPGVLNGPAGSPTAIGPTGTNDDFNNKSAAIDPAQAKTLQFNPDGTPKAGTGMVDPAAVGFGNTVQNTGSTPATITLLPNGNPVQPDGSTLPDGTKVTITNPAGQSATYTLTGTTWTPAPGSTPVTITVAPGATGNYSTQVDLPMSDQLKGYGVAIVAFVDDATPGYQGTEPSNTTIDRVYTGYLKLKKEARILSGTNGTEKQTWTTDSTLLKVALPTDKIEYRISYENISSSAPAGSNSVQLNARNVSINEDGAAAPNTWAATTTHVPGAVYKESNATVTYAPVNSDADLTTTKYTYQVTSDLTPGQTGKFQFTRVVK